MKFKKEDYGFVTDIPAVVNGERIKGYDAWLGMIHRCYNVKSPNYKWYGACGIYVCDEWKSFKAFKIWYDENNPNGDLHMDKDSSDMYFYSPETIIFMTKEENSRIMAVGKSGSLNSMAKPKSYYKTKSSYRHSFKKICTTRGWNFDDFEEIYSGETNANHQKRYFYKEK